MVAEQGDEASATSARSFCGKTQDEVRKLIAGSRRLHLRRMRRRSVLDRASARMAWRAPWWRLTGRFPEGDEEPATSR